MKLTGNYMHYNAENGWMVFSVVMSCMPALHLLLYPDNATVYLSLVSKIKDSGHFPLS